MAASDEGTNPLVRFFKRSLVQYNSFSDSSSSSTDQRLMSNRSCVRRNILYASSSDDKVSPEMKIRVLEKQEIIRRLLSQRSPDAAPSMDEILNSVFGLLFVGGAILWLCVLFKYVNSNDAKLRAKARAKRSGNNNNNNDDVCHCCGRSGKISSGNKESEL